MIDVTNVNLGAVHKGRSQRGGGRLVKADTCGQVCGVKDFADVRELVLFYSSMIGPIVLVKLIVLVKTYSSSQR